MTSDMTFADYWEKNEPFGCNPEEVAELAWNAASARAVTTETADYAADIMAILEKTTDQEFLDRLIKESPEAEMIMMDCGRIRLLRAAKAAILLYMKMFADAALSAGRTE